NLRHTHAGQAAEHEGEALFRVDLVQNAAELEQSGLGLGVVGAGAALPIVGSAHQLVDESTSFALPHLAAHHVHGDGHDVATDTAGIPNVACAFEEPEKNVTDQILHVAVGSQGLHQQAVDE